MSISPLKKVLFVIHRDEKSGFLAFIQRRGVLHITELTQPYVLDAFGELAREGSSRLSDLVALTAQIDFAVGFLAPYGPRKGLLSALTPKKPTDVQELARLAESTDVRPVIDRSLSLSREMSELFGRITKLESFSDTLRPWTALDVPVQQLRDTGRVCQILFMIFKTSPKTVAGELGAVGTAHVLSPVRVTKEYSYYHFVCHEGDRAAYEEALARLGAEREALPDRTGTFREIRSDVREEIGTIRRRISTLESEARVLASRRDELVLLSDYYLMEKEREEVIGGLASSAGATYLEGWIPQKEVIPIRDEINLRFPLVEMVAFDPAEGDVPPTLLENEGVVRPFEIITSLYGMPDPKEFDPTPFYALFYALFFGTCLTDAGYGVVMSILLFFILFRFKYTLGRNKIVQVLLVGALFTIVIGAVTGGWFGDLLTRLPEGSRLREIGRSLVIFDPLKDTITFMLLCLALGFIHVNLGMIVGLVKLIKNGKRREAFIKLCWIVFVLCAVVLVADYMSAGGVPRWGMKAAIPGISAASVGIVLFSQPEKNVIARVLWGLYNLYGGTGFLGDILSYLRLLALGLSTGIIATVVNLVATLVGAVPYVGIVLSVVVLVFGHAFNIAINCLGAFVHTTRLQYVEFFNKFYDGSGKPFAPFKINPKYVCLREALE